MRDPGQVTEPLYTLPPSPIGQGGDSPVYLIGLWGGRPWNSVCLEPWQLLSLLNHFSHGKHSANDSY